jgi:hypothetical protein
VGLEEYVRQLLETDEELLLEIEPAFQFSLEARSESDE